MRVEKVNERWLLCGYFLADEQIKPGQVWAPADGGNREITVVSTDGEWVTYEGPTQPRHEKMIFAFQCRYCLVLPTNEIPKELL